MATTAMALSSQSLSSPPPVPNLTTTISATQSPPNFIFHHRKSSATAIISFPQKIDRIGFSSSQSSQKWRINVSSFPAFLNNKSKDAKILKEELLEAIAPLDRGAEATPEDQKRVDQIARKLEAVNPTKEPLKSNLLDGKWELIYTTSQSILQVKRPKFLRSVTNYQAINVDTLRAQNMESWPFFNQVTADLTPLNARKVAVQFDYFKIGGLIPVKAPGRARGELQITYLDEELRISRGDKGNLFILKMVDPSYRSFLTKSPDVNSLKQELLEAIAPLDRGAEATPEDQEHIARRLEAANQLKEPLNSDLLNGKWELLYTTSKSILQTEFVHTVPSAVVLQRPKFLRPSGKIYQAINVDTLRAQNMETWPFFNQATANLVPLNAKRVAVKFDSFKIAGVIRIKARGSGRGQLEITYLDEELRISRGNQGNLSILRMVDPSYRVPL
ncbi:hypothetical protein M9H77_20833 [Catharanthus roseus]|uniref:Uncharacterized protein n=1 Tax=Catharanthus roseus TaxID=4058 RepID=A0ACC0AKU6_CATRO|nr:hypothetical protein M9H77_20833 [Catharanthus roseus]